MRVTACRVIVCAEPRWGISLAQLTAAVCVCRIGCRSGAAGCPLYRLPAALLQAIMTEGIPVVSCTCSATPLPPADMESQEGAAASAGRSLHR